MATDEQLQHQVADTTQRLENFNERLARSRELQEKISSISEEIGTIDTRLSECRSRLQELCRTGRRPADEALVEFDRNLERLAGEGRDRLDRILDEFTRPRHESPVYRRNYRPAPQLSEALSTSPNGRVSPEPVFVHLLYDALKARGHAVIEAACADTDLPAEDERLSEISDLGKEVEKLRAEKLELQEQVSKLMRQLQNLLDTRPRPPGVYSGNAE